MGLGDPAELARRPAPTFDNRPAPRPARLSATGRPWAFTALAYVRSNDDVLGGRRPPMRLEWVEAISLLLSAEPD